MHSDHLVKRSNGNYHFRLVLPTSLKRSLGKREIHHSLKTKKKRIAISRANQLYRGYMDMKKKEAVVLQDFLVSFADGTKVQIKHDDPEEERKHLKAVFGVKSDSGRVTPVQKNLSDLITAYLEDTKTSVTARTQTERRGALRAFLGLYDT